MDPARPDTAIAVPLRRRALALWMEADPAAKAEQTRTLWAERDRHPLDAVVTEGKVFEDGMHITTSTAHTGGAA